MGLKAAIWAGVPMAGDRTRSYTAKAPINSNRQVINTSPRKKIQVIDFIPTPQSQKPIQFSQAAQRSLPEIGGMTLALVLPSNWYTGTIS